jgi:hypothetical protein
MVPNLRGNYVTNDKARLKDDHFSKKKTRGNASSKNSSKAVKFDKLKTAPSPSTRSTPGRRVAG